MYASCIQTQPALGAGTSTDDRASYARLLIATAFVAGLGLYAAFGCCLGSMSAAEMALMSSPICHSHAAS